MPFYWGIAADGTVAFSDDAKLIKQACGKSFAPFPQGMFLSLYSDFASCFSQTLLTRQSGFCGLQLLMSSSNISLGVE